MNRLILTVAVGVMLSACGSKKGEVLIELPDDFKEKTLVVSHINIENSIKATSADEVIVYYDTLEVRDGRAHLSLDPKGPTRYDIIPPVMSTMDPEFYASPGDDLKVVIRSFNPLDYEVTGSELMDDLTAFNAIATPIRQEYVRRINSEENISQEEVKAMLDSYDDAVKKFAADHPKSPAVPYIIMDLSGDDFKAIYDNLTPEARKSILMPYAEGYNKSVVMMQQERDREEARKEEVASGTIKAPDFTFPDLSGKKVSLSDFRGKWVVLDFWGTWCGWCIKGFPALKEAYRQYGDKIVIIGIDCNDSEEEWREGVKKYELPWLSLYNGFDKKIYAEYNIEGFPTKAIINPEGYLVDLTTGEDPAFFDRLAAFVK